MEKLNHQYAHGTIISSKKELKVACNDGFLIIDSLKLAGKRKMDIASLLNGYLFAEDAKML